jgi:hypothetical protein
MNQLLRESPVYLAVAISSMLIMCFVVHAMVGGLVSLKTEYTLYAVVCLLDAIAIGFMARDVIKRRRQSTKQED